MIPYEDLCRALDIHNRKLRGEDVPEEAYQEHALDDEFDIVESADMEHDGTPMDGHYAEGVPDVTAETAVPDAEFGGYEQQPGSGEYAEGEYDSGAVPGQPAEGMTADQYSSGQQPQAEYDSAQQQVAEGYEQAPEPPPEAYPDDQDPNRQQ